MNILVLTDHETHRDGESIYPLLKEMNLDERTKRICVASRSADQNQEGFFDCESTKLFASEVTEQYSYSQSGNYYTTGSYMDAVDDFDVTFLRLDRPKTGTLDNFLSFVEGLSKEIVVINKPSGICSTGSKKFLLDYPNLCPDMMLCDSLDTILDFLGKTPLVLKPLESYGGKGIIKIVEKKVWVEDSVHHLSNMYSYLETQIEKQGPYLAMEYLNNNHLGDKRIVVVNGEIMGATLRYPKTGSWLCNLSKDGSAGAADVDDNERYITSAISPEITRRGVVIYGFDTLVDNKGSRILSEVNTLNVGGLYEAERYSGQPVVKKSSNLIINYCENEISHSSQKT